MITYIATVGTKYKIDEFVGSVMLRKDHKERLEGEVYYLDERRVKIETELRYNIGQCVSIGGYPMGRKKFRLIELSITDNPVLSGARIIEKEERTNDN